LALVKGDPNERRRFMDDLLIARTPRLAGVRADYDRVLKQRNALLRSAGAAIRQGRPGADVHTLEAWDSHLAESGAALLAARLELVTALRPLVDKAYDSISSGHGPTALDYVSSLGPQAALEPDRSLLATALLAGMAQRRTDELDRGVSLVGPHRDDLVLRLGPSPAKGYASHGEAWSYALALRLASYDLLKADGGEPVLILDDVFAELDDQRRNRLAELVALGTQVLVTAAVPADVPSRLSGTRVDVAAGEVRRVH
jgi:DNA replication and repair protein RecF